MSNPLIVQSTACITPSSDSFVKAMRDHWEESLRNASSDALLACWGSIWRAFRDAIVESFTLPEGPRRWKVLNPPTGTGKTESLKVFCSLAARENRERLGEGIPLGVLIVTARTADADLIASDINRLAGFPCATERHSKSEVTVGEAARFDVLVITHERWLGAMMDPSGDSMDDVLRWDGGRRRLVVIDEAMSNLVEEYSVTAEEIMRHVDPFLRYVRRECPAEVEAVTSIREILEDYEENATHEGGKQAEVAWKHGTDSFSFGRLRTALVAVFRARRQIAEEERALAVLNRVEAIYRSWAYRARVGYSETLNSARLLIPDDLPVAPVVLDATADQNVLWELLGDRVDLRLTSPGARSYARVTLWQVRAPGLGRDSMTKKGHERIPEILLSVEEALGNNSGRQVFMCVHKDNRALAEKSSQGFKAGTVDVGHFGAIDGRNDWKDCDVVLIAGIPYRSDRWAWNTDLAARGVPEDGRLGNLRIGAHNAKEKMIQSQITVDVVQAINRAQCRKVVDTVGNCLPTDVFLVVPEGERGEALLQGIETAMPGIRIRPWNFTFTDGGPESRLKEGSIQRALYELMLSAPPGEHSDRWVMGCLGIDKAGWRPLTRALLDLTHPLHRSLQEIGVAYRSTKGRRGRSFLYKSASSPMVPTGPFVTQADDGFDVEEGYSAAMAAA